MAVVDAAASMTTARVIWGDATGLPVLDAPTVVTVGTFDGVHRGHRRLIARAIEEAGRLELEAVALTWDRHPRSVVGGAPPLVTTANRKVELLAESGLDLVVVLRLDEAFMQWPPDRFAREVFAEALRARVVVVGSDWRFGHRAAGNVPLLADLGRVHDFTVIPVERAGPSAEPASSTRIRNAVANGDLSLASTLLGRVPELDCVRGEPLGRRAVVELSHGLVCPPAGEYRARVELATGWAPCTAVIEGDHRIQIDVGDCAAADCLRGHVRLQLEERLAIAS